MRQTVISEYRSWIFRTRQVTMLVLAVLVWEVVGSSLCSHAELMNVGLQFFEPYIATANSYLVILIVPIFSLIMMSDYPNLDEGYIFTICRMGKTRWLLGKVLFAFICSVSVVLFVMVVSILPCIGHIDLGRMWSPATTKLAYYYPDLEYNPVFNLIQRDVYNHMYPGVAAMHSCFLSVLLIFGYSLMLLVGKIYDKKYIFIGLNVLIMAAGGIFTTMKSRCAFFFPAGHAALAGRFNEIERASKMPFWMSYLYMTVWIIIMLVFAVIGIKRRNICTK